MPYKPSEIEEKLQRKFGFERSRSQGVDHRYYQLKLEGLPLILTKVSHNKKDVGPVLESKITKQIRVRKEFFREMMDCAKSRDDYYRQVREDPYPPFEDFLLRRT